MKSVLQNGFKQREEKSPAAASESRMYADTSKKVASGKEGKQLAVAQECQGKMSHCRAPSGIPSDIQVPELTFGGPLADGTQQERPGIIPFSSYAPCRLLDVRPDCLVTFFNSQKADAAGRVSDQSSKYPDHGIPSRFSRSSSCVCNFE